MNREEIRHAAYRRMAEIEELCLHGTVPSNYRAYWLLNYLIAKGLEAYFSEYGWLPIDLSDANDGRIDIGEGELSPFERECIQLLNQKIEQLEAQDASARRLRYI